MVAKKKKTKLLQTCWIMKLNHFLWIFEKLTKGSLGCFWKWATFGFWMRQFALWRRKNWIHRWQCILHILNVHWNSKFEGFQCQGVVCRSEEYTRDLRTRIDRLWCVNPWSTQFGRIFPMYKLMAGIFFKSSYRAIRNWDLGQLVEILRHQNFHRTHCLTNYQRLEIKCYLKFTLAHSMTPNACYCIVLKVQSFFAEFWTLCDSLGWPTCVLVNKGFLGVNILVDILEILEILDTKPLWIFVNVYEYEFIWAILVNRLNTTLLILFRKKVFWAKFRETFLVTFLVIFMVSQ